MPAPPAVRLRQVVIGTSRLDAVAAELNHLYDLAVTDHIDDAPSHTEFSLRSATLTVGSQFVEIVEPRRPDAPVARHLERLGGDGGYMLILEVASAQWARERAESLGVRVIWEGGTGVHAVHLHPLDIGGTLLSLGEARPPGTWSQGGPHWESEVRTSVATSIGAATVATQEPSATAERWAALLRRPLADATSVALDDSVIRFVPAGDQPPHGPNQLDLVSPVPDRRGEERVVGGVRFRLV
jgi:hypothetical protein